MGIPWKRIFTIGESVGMGIASAFLPGAVTTAIHVVEDNLPMLKGPQKKAAALAIAKATVEATDALAEKDLLNDPAIQSLIGEFIDVYVAYQNARAKVEAAIETAKHVKGTGQPLPAPPVQ